MRKMIFTLLACSMLVLTACSNDNKEAEKDLSAEKDIVELVEEYSTGDFENLQASITSTELIVTYDDEKEEKYQLPEDKFFISIAPYEEVTHPCTNHSLTGCQGEMVKETFEVEIVDSNGNIVLDETMETMENGFIDLWLPRNDEYVVKINYEGKTAEEIISTYKDDRTCITTMQLEEAEEI